MARNKLGMIFGMVFALSACTGGEGEKSAQSAAEPQAAAAKVAEPEVVNIDQAAALFAQKAVPVDANGDGTRKEFGVIPGARLLTSSSQYDCEKELPADKSTTLVFYCGNEHCSASDTAAERALSAGYQKVKVLRAGIAGWKESGQKTETPAS